MRLHRVVDSALSVLDRRNNKLEAEIAGIERLGKPHLFTQEPDIDVGISLGRDDCPQIFFALYRLSKSAGGSAPTEIRLSYLPACGVFEYGDPNKPRESKRVLILGYPCLQIWSQAELLAVIAHELAHLVFEDAKAIARFRAYEGVLRRRSSTRSRRFIATLRRQWACAFVDHFSSNVRDAAWDAEFHADRMSARFTSPRVIASALRKLAMATPLFQDVLATAVEEDPELRVDVYQRFQKLWLRVIGPGDEKIKIRRQILDTIGNIEHDSHPSLRARLEALQKSSPRGWRRADRSGPAIALIREPDRHRRALHNRMFQDQLQKSSTFEPD